MKIPKPTVWALFTNGYVNEDGSIIDPKRVTYHPEQDEIRAFASKHGYHNENYHMVQSEIVRDDAWGIELESIEDTEVYFEN